MKTKKDKELILEQLRKTPIVQIACEKVGIGKATYYRWRKKDKKFLERSDTAISEGILLVNDMAESQLLRAIRDGNLPEVNFWLKHHHPSYETRVELRQAVSLADENLSKVQKEAVIKALELFGESKKYLAEGSDNSGE